MIRSNPADIDRFWKNSEKSEHASTSLSESEEDRLNVGEAIIPGNEDVSDSESEDELSSEEDVFGVAFGVVCGVVFGDVYLGMPSSTSCVQKGANRDALAPKKITLITHNISTIINLLCSNERNSHNKFSKVIAS